MGKAHTNYNIFRYRLRGDPVWPPEKSKVNPQKHCRGGVTPPEKQMQIFAGDSWIACKIHKNHMRIL